MRDAILPLVLPGVGATTGGLNSFDIVGLVSSLQRTLMVSDFFEQFLLCKDKGGRTRGPLIVKMLNFRVSRDDVPD